MKDIRINNPNEPYPLHDIINLGSERPEIDTTETAPEPEEDALAPGELVDFYITPPAAATIRGIVGWTKVLIFSMAVLVFVEILLLTILVATANTIVLPVFLAMLRSMLSAGFLIWLIILSMKFVKTMGAALKSNDTDVLSEAFRIQTNYFKWAFLNIVVTVSYAIFEGLLLTLS